MFSLTNLNDTLRAIASALQIPVTVVLLLLLAATVLMLGSLIAEVFTERRHLKVKMPQLMDDLRAQQRPVAEVLRDSGLLKRQKKALLELTHHPELTCDMREALARRLIFEEQAHYDRITKITDMIARLGPMFGLLGTLIPLGPGIIALGQGDTYTLSMSLLTAFDTTIAGLSAAAVAFVISAIRKNWYENYMTALETAMEGILETLPAEETPPQDTSEAMPMTAPSHYAADKQLAAQAGTQAHCAPKK